MSSKLSRREIVKSGLASLGLASFSVPLWTLPVLAQGETVVPFLDFPANFNANPSAVRRFLDTRTIDNFITPADQFYTFQHFAQPMVDPATFKLKVAGMFSKPRDFTLAELKALTPSLEQIVAYECGGNGPRNSAQGMVSNGRWKGIGLATLLKHCGISPDAVEVAFYAADFEPSDVTHGGRGAIHIDKAYFARSLSVVHAMKPEPMLAWELNGAPLTVNQGSPLRLIVPGWYGVAQVKWVNHIQAQANRLVSRFMSRDYVTVRDRKVGEEVETVEYTVGPIQLKSVVARVTKTGNTVKITGFALSDLTPIKSVEVSIDGGPWLAATMDKQNTKTSWKIFSYSWNGATPGEHAIVSRATDINGVVQLDKADPTK
ncbi:MAG TPA: molybdopterin-dependent oxidoreductase, partial [Terriglobia bacterium]|nr:molybdopterin-dependent oxidoreductase [Terriglobia bacterium]